jgi:exopolysaccharide biosynthesis protein
MARPSVPTCCYCNLQDGKSPHSASYRGCSHAKQELQRRRKLRAKTSASKYATQDRAFASALRSSEQQHPQQPSQKNGNSLQDKNTHQDTNHQISGQSVQAENVNINATDGVLLAFAMVQQVMTKLSGAATEKENVAVINE